MTLSEQDVSEKKSKKAGSSVKRSSRKKAKDKPKRPLSAYNYFFKTERQRILKYLGRKNEPNTESSEDQEEVVDAEQESKLVTESGKVSFEEMGKLIGRRWKAITPEKLEHYNKLAAQDADRYKKELAEYNEKKEKGAIHEAHRNAMMQMQSGSQHGGPGGRPDYYPPPPYHGGPSPPSSMSMYGPPYSSGMGGPPYMSGPMYHGHYGGGYPEYNPSGGYGSGRGNPPEGSYPQSGPPHNPHHPSSGPGGSSGYSQGSMDPYGGGGSDYSMPPSQGGHHPGDHPSQGHGGPQAHSGYGSGGGGGSASGGYPSQQYGSHGGYGGPSSYPQGGPSDQHLSSSQGGHQRWG